MEVTVRDSTGFPTIYGNIQRGRLTMVKLNSAVKEMNDLALWIEKHYGDESVEVYISSIDEWHTDYDVDLLSDNDHVAYRFLGDVLYNYYRSMSMTGL